MLSTLLRQRAVLIGTNDGEDGVLTYRLCRWRRSRVSPR
jgi:hypothetical protein